MVRNVEINCPFHHKNETLSLPDSYVCYYKGSFTCGDSDLPITVVIELKDLRVIAVNEAKNIRLPEQKPKDTSNQVLAAMKEATKQHEELVSKSREIERLKQILSENKIEFN